MYYKTYNMYYTSTICIYKKCVLRENEGNKRISEKKTKWKKNKCNNKNNIIGIRNVLLPANSTVNLFFRTCYLYMAKYNKCVLHNTTLARIHTAVDCWHFTISQLIYSVDIVYLSYNIYTKRNYLNPINHDHSWQVSNSETNCPGISKNEHHKDWSFVHNIIYL